MPQRRSKSTATTRPARRSGAGRVPGSAASPSGPPAPAGEFKLRGSAETAASGLSLPLSTLRDQAKVVAEFRPGVTRAAAPERTVSVRPEDIVEIELDDGQRLWMSGQEYRERYARVATRDASGEDLIVAPAQLQVLPPGMQTRGPVAWVVKSLKVVGLDLSKQSALGIAQLVDNKTSDTRRPGLGLHRCRTETGKFALAGAGKQDVGTDQPHLLFLHGTASSTWSSFGDLWSAERSTELRALRNKYGNGIFAFEHGSLATSPVGNAIDLLKSLPKGARLHLVTHSRGGLVGELLCRARRTQGDPFGSREIQAYRAALNARAEEIEEDINVAGRVAELEELNRRLMEVRPVVERCVRVACPTLGTTLASRRLDRWLSVIGNVCGMALPDTPLSDWFSDIGDFIATVVAKRTDPATLPGLEAMMPDSGLIRVVNWPTAEVDGDLTVVAGDIDPDAWWAKLLIWATDRFYEGDHDLVVNTASMFGGTTRAGEELASRHKGGSVNHFNYFKNKSSAEALVRGLTRKAGDSTGFEPLERPTEEIARAVVIKPSPTPRPVVFVLPGIMGSELFVGRDKVWVDIPDLMFGGIKQIKIDAKQVEPFQPVPRYYGDLVNFLENSHKAIQFAFDWRLPIEDEADRLAERVRTELQSAAKAGKPVSLLAHSMGGLVARTMIARHPDVWQDMCKHPSARLIMLGTPNGGSHAITELLVGQSATLRSLAAVDLTQKPQDLLRIVSRFPGVLAMLPKDSRENYFSPQTWASYFERAGHGWVLPDAKDLARAQRFRDLFDRAPVDAQRMIYVAGSADVTVAAMEFDAQSKKIQFLGTPRGDGRVTWDSGIPNGVPTWYMDVEHGDLCAYPPAFPALRELLESGTTSRLSQAPKVARGADEVFPMPREALELLPTEEVLTATLLGAGSRKRKTRARAKIPVRVRVVHGNLAFAKHPVAVGHYANDAIVSAEKYLDAVLDGELSQRHQLGLYPGPIGTSAAFVKRTQQAAYSVGHPGAIIVGLGTAGQLNAGALGRTFTRALLEYVLEADKDLPDLGLGQDAGGLKTVGVAALLIGSGAGGVTVSDCVYALLSGVDLANDSLEQARQGTRIAQIDLFELWEDRAIQAVEVLQELARRPDLRDKFNAALSVDRTDGGLRRIRYDEPAGWWHRLQILGGGKEGEPGAGTLRFASSTRRARSEVRLQRTQRAIVDGFIERAIRQTTDDDAVAGTLFELLLPNELKEQAPDRGDVVLLLDEDAARYPWELLRDPSRPDSPPLAIEQGALRQLESYEFRESVRAVIDSTALVIGDPESSFPELPGARKEAETVWQALRSRGDFQVEKRIRPRAQEVMIALYAKPYRVLHLAGHGVYRYLRTGATQCDECGQPLSAEELDRRVKEEERITGMVIGDNTFLTPIEVKQMRQVPELVFINCCHLGHIEASAGRDASARNERTDYNRIAANVSTEFIRMGVRAVVAAGWAVDDDAAALFARTFYERMLSGVAFGKAVHQARVEVYRRFPRSNTWGAYQCYGDPDWKLVRDAGDVPSERDAELFASPMQAAIELQNLAARLKTGALAPESGREALAALVARLTNQQLLDNPQVLASLGRAYGEAELFADAVRILRTALTTEKAQATVSDIELLANLEARAAVHAAAEGKPSPQEAERVALEEISIAIRRLEALTAAAAAQGQSGAQAVTTVERLSLLGSAYKRKAWISARERTASLEHSRDFYREAYLRKKDTYPFLNLLTGEIALSWHRRAGASPDLTRLLDEDLPNSQASLRDALSRNRDFWNSAMLADLQLLEALGRGTLDTDILDEIATGYRTAAQRGSPREFASVLDQLHFIATMARDQKPDINRWLQQLHARITRPETEQTGGVRKPGSSGGTAAVQKARAARASRRPRKR